MNLKDEKGISCRLTNAIIDYVKKENGDVKDLLKDLEHSEEYLSDRNNWISLKSFDAVCVRLKRLFKDNEILFKVGLSVKESAIADIAARFIGDPQYIIRKAPTYNVHFNKISRLTVLKNSSTSATIKIAPLPGYAASKDLCYFSAGTLISMLHIQGLKPVKIIEEECCIPISAVGTIKGKIYEIDSNNYVWQYNARDRDIKEGPGEIVGRLDPNGTFRLGETTFGAPACIYHLTWSFQKKFPQKIYFNIFQKPRLLEVVVNELGQVNEFLEQKCDEIYQNFLDFQKAYVEAISAFIAAVDAKDPYTKNHSKNVASYAVEMAKAIGLSSQEMEDIGRACQLHDLGKISMPLSIITKPRRLTDEEWKMIREHPVLGAELIRPMAFLKNVLPMIRQDHERYDGKGYPDGLKEDEICIGARIIAITDSYDTMISGRSYRPPISKEEALEELKRCSGTQFDPKLIKVFLRIMSKEISPITEIKTASEY